MIESANIFPSLAGRFCWDGFIVPAHGLERIYGMVVGCVTSVWPLTRTLMARLLPCCAAKPPELFRIV